MVVLFCKLARAHICNKVAIDTNSKGDMKMAKKTSVAKLFGISEKKADVLTKKVRHTQIDAEDMIEFAKLLKLEETGEAGFVGFLYGRLAERNDEGHILF